MFSIVRITHDAWLKAPLAVSATEFHANAHCIHKINLSCHLHEREMRCAHANIMSKVKKCPVRSWLTKHMRNQMFCISSFRPICDKRMNGVTRMCEPSLGSFVKLDELSGSVGSVVERALAHRLPAKTIFPARRPQVTRKRERRFRGEIELHQSSLPRVARFSSDSAKKSTISEDLGSKTTPWVIGHW